MQNSNYYYESYSPESTGPRASERVLSSQNKRVSYRTYCDCNHYQLYDTVAITITVVVKPTTWRTVFIISLLLTCNNRHVSSSHKSSESDNNIYCYSNSHNYNYSYANSVTIDIKNKKQQYRVIVTSPIRTEQKIIVNTNSASTPRLCVTSIRINLVQAIIQDKKFVHVQFVFPKRLIKQ